MRRVVGARDPCGRRACRAGALPRQCGCARHRAGADGPAATPRVGRKHFPQTLPLEPKEIVLTFDDGPEPGTTARVLDALKRECVQATFFLLGRKALAYPDLARRELNEGHTVAHHTFSHPLLDRMPVALAEAEIERGFAGVDTALYGHASREPATPFFRFPGFASVALAGAARRRAWWCSARIMGGD
jgi:peptidoglycan/xylan/chitin deacetylase (PgdA/CDA1 family)